MPQTNCSPATPQQGRSLETETSWTEQEPRASRNEVVPRSHLLSLRRAPTCRLCGPRGSDGQAGRSGPFGLQWGHASFPRKAGGRRQRVRALRTPARGQGHQAQPRGCRSPSSPKLLGGPSTGSSACGVSELARAAGSVLLCAPAGSLLYLLQTGHQPPHPSLSPESWPWPW